jgi:hypothetical protein
MAENEVKINGFPTGKIVGERKTVTLINQTDEQIVIKPKTLEIPIEIEPACYKQIPKKDLNNYDWKKVKDLKIEIEGKTVKLVNESKEKIGIPSNIKPSNSIVISPKGRKSIKVGDLEHYEMKEVEEKITKEYDEPLFVITNQTAKKIAIEPFAHSPDKSDRLVIPPCGRLILKESICNEYECAKWEKNGLIRIKQKAEKLDEKKEPGAAMALLFQWLIWGIWVKDLIVTNVFSGKAGSLWAWLLYGGVTACFLLYIFLKTRANLYNVVLALNLFFYFASVILLLGLTLYYFGGLRVLGHLTPLNNLYKFMFFGRVLQFVFILILVLLPGFLYFQFERTQIPTLRKRFLREILIFDPHLQTEGEVKENYKDLIDEISEMQGEKSRQYSLLTAGRPILFATLLMVLGWVYVLMPVSFEPMVTTMQVYNFFSGLPIPPLILLPDIHVSLDAGVLLRTFLYPQATTIGMAFLGAYFFAIGMIFRRYVRGDLNTKAYSHVTVRILMSIIVAWVIDLLFVTQSHNSNFSFLSPATAMGIAFMVGIFPQSGVAVIQGFLKKMSGFAYLFKSMEEQHPITDLEGVNVYDRVRLLEEGIESVENIAHYNIIELMMRTRIPTSRLVDLVDQAILYLHVRGPVEIGTVTEHTQENEGEESHAAENQESKNNKKTKKSGERGALKYLRQYGIRTASDLVRVFESADDEETKKLLDLLGPKDKSKPRRLRVILDALEDDEWFEYIRQWRMHSEKKIYTLQEFLHTKQEGKKPVEKTTQVRCSFWKRLFS